MPAKFTSQAAGSAEALRGQGPAIKQGHSSPELIRAESQGEACHRVGRTREMGLMLPRSPSAHPPPPRKPGGLSILHFTLVLYSESRDSSLYACFILSGPPPISHSSELQTSEAQFPLLTVPPHTHTHTLPRLFSGSPTGVYKRSLLRTAFPDCPAHGQITLTCMAGALTLREHSLRAM